MIGGVKMCDSDKNKSLWIVKLSHYKAPVCTIELVETATKIFSKEQKAKDWLISKGFVFGKSKEFKNDCDPYWFNQTDNARDFTEVELGKIEIDSDEESWVDHLICHHREDAP